MTTPANLGAMLAEARRRRGLPKTQLAASAGVSRNTLQQLEAGLGNVELRTLLAICQVLDLDVVLAPKAVSKKVQAEHFASPVLRPLPSGDLFGRTESQRPRTSFLSRMVSDKERAATSPTSKPASKKKDSK